MVILFIVGLAVEEALGKRRYLVFYLLAGLGAGVFDLVFNASRTAPGIGASGAISGVMAMFVALYGLRKIRFLLLGARLFRLLSCTGDHRPALVDRQRALPVPVSTTRAWVNYVAHLSGFVTGTGVDRRAALLRQVARRRPPSRKRAIDPLPGELSRVDALLGALRIDEGAQGPCAT